MTDADIPTYMGALVLPDGWELRARVMRTFPLRAEWALLLYRDGKYLRGNRGVYASTIRGEVASYRDWIATQPVPLTVTTDAEGFVTSIEEVA